MDRHNWIIVVRIDCDLWPWQMVTLRLMLELYGSHKETTMEVLVCEGLSSPSLMRGATHQIGAAPTVSHRFGLRQMDQAFAVFARTHDTRARQSGALPANCAHGVAAARSHPEMAIGVTCPPREPVDLDLDLECLIQWTATWVYQPPPDQTTRDVNDMGGGTDRDTAGLR